MGNNLLCPFCGAELETYYDEYEDSHGDICHEDSGLLICGSYGRNCMSHHFKMPPEIWKILIDGKNSQEKLKVAISALGLVGNGKGDEQGICRYVDEKNCESVRDICRSALAKIKSMDVGKLMTERFGNLMGLIGIIAWFTFMFFVICGLRR